jgi:hypothetical protein
MVTIKNLGHFLPNVTIAWVKKNWGLIKTYPKDFPEVLLVDVHF